MNANLQRLIQNTITKLAAAGIEVNISEKITPLAQPGNLAATIDHTVLKAEATAKDIITACDEAKQYKFASVCVNPFYIPLVAEQLAATGVKPITVVGFPLGATTTSSKVFTAKEAIANGAQEIDMVINIGALKAEDYQTVYNDISEVVTANKPHPVKVILEMSNLTIIEKIAGCLLAKAAKAAFVKTSTGFGKGGATVEDIELMHSLVGDTMHIKASGGIRNQADALAMLRAGASRIGTSAGVLIVSGKTALDQLY